jgi:hypothetical protein
MFMTVKELIANLQALDNPDLPVFLQDEQGTIEITHVGFCDEAYTTAERIEIREKVMAFHNGKEILVEVPKFINRYDYTPGVVLS